MSQCVTTPLTGWAIFIGKGVEGIAMFPKTKSFLHLGGRVSSKDEMKLLAHGIELHFGAACHACKREYKAVKGCDYAASTDLMELAYGYYEEIKPYKEQTDFNLILVTWAEEVQRLEEAIIEEADNRFDKIEQDENKHKKPDRHNKQARRDVVEIHITECIQMSALYLAQARTLIDIDRATFAPELITKAIVHAARASAIALHNNALTKGLLLINRHSVYAKTRSEKYKHIATQTYSEYLRLNTIKKYKSLRAASRCKELQAIALQYSIEIGVPLAESNIENWLYNKLREQHKLAKSKHVTTPSKS